MKQYKVRITRLAKKHLRNIFAHIIQEYKAPETAKDMLRGLREEMASLSEMPSRAKTIDEEPWGSMGVRKVRYKNYYIYFWINEGAKKLQIMGVIYVGREQDKQLEQMEIDD